MILDDFIDAIKLKATKMQLYQCSMDMIKVALDAVAMLRLMADKKGLLFQVQMLEEKQWVKRDEPRIGRAVINILSNAIKFTEYGLIKIKVSKVKETEKEACYFLSIQDTGIGMSDKGRSRLFSRFSRVNVTLSPQIQSTGLGLYITKKLVKLMQGSIQVESNKGQGI